MRSRLGYVLISLAVLHEVVGLFFYREALLEIVDAGVVNTVNPPHWDRDAAYWFLMFGVVLFLIGWAVQWLLVEVGYIPVFVSAGLLLMSVVGVIIMPANGLWLAIPVALLMLTMRQERTLRAAPSVAQ